MSHFASAKTPAGFTATLFANDLKDPRGLLITENDLHLVLERGGSACVTLLWDDDDDGVSSTSERLRCIATAPRLNHGLAVFNGYLFASSDTIVYRWPWAGGRNVIDSNLRKEIVINIAYGADGSSLGADRGHTTRTLAFDRQGRLFVSVGSYGNVDANSHRSRVRVFDGLAEASAAAVEFNSGAVWADGLRNEVGLAFDASGVLWGVENGADNLNRADIGGDVHNTNPGEELNKLDRPGAYYGYPRCWSEDELAAPHGLGARTQWAWPSFMPATTDAWCRDPANVVPPSLVMPAHTAPLGIAFFGAADAHLPLQQQPGPTCAGNTNSTTASSASSAGTAGAFPCAWVGDAFVALHGSWNRQPPVGYSLVRLPFSGGEPTGEVLSVVAHGGDGAVWAGGVRPVDVRFDSRGRLFFTSDKSNELVMVTYSGGGMGGDDAGGGGGDAAAGTNVASGGGALGDGRSGALGVAAVVGIAVGATAAAALAALVAARWYFRGKRRARSRNSDAMPAGLSTLSTL